MIKNKAEFNFDDLYILFGPNAVKNFPEDFTSTGVSIDTRTIEEGNCFIPLKGTNQDGHDRIEEAFEKGASFALANTLWCRQNPELLEKYKIIQVKNTESALAYLANHHREKFRGPIIAVAGSNGKTTTKELIASVLSTKYNVLKTYKNFNNQLGVPLMLLALNDTYDIAVLEIATNSVGEIERLCKVCEPTHGVITNIGKEHLELLVDLDGVELEETALFTYLRQNTGLAFINMDDERLGRYPQVIEKRFAYGTKQGNVTALVKYDEDHFPIMKIKYDNNIIDAKINVPGYPGAINALAAASIGIALHIDFDEIKKGLQSYKADDSDNYGRLKIQNHNGIRIINDTYNANPSSMMSAMNTLVDMKINGNKYVAIGDMLEMGDEANKEHKEIYSFAIDNFEKVYLFGDEFSKVHDELSSNKAFYFYNKSELIADLNSNLNEDDALLVKGSRGMKMEEVVLGVLNS